MYTDGEFYQEDFRVGGMYNVKIVTGIAGQGYFFLEQKKNGMNKSKER